MMRLAPTASSRVISILVLSSFGLLLYPFAAEADIVCEMLLLNGGDASESYGVKIRFNARRVISRTVVSSLDADKPLEETTYHEVVLD